jgi:hypothetical protein
MTVARHPPSEDSRAGSVAAKKSDLNIHFVRDKSNRICYRRMDDYE